MNHQPIILETPRLILRTPKQRDAEKIRAFGDRNVHHFAKWQPTNVGADPWQREIEEKSSIRFIVFLRDELEGEIIGQCSFSQIFRGAFQACYLGYRIGVEYENQGLMAEAVSKAIQYIFENQNLHRIMAGYIPSNARSAKLLEKLGFTIEGHAKNYLLINGRWEDHVLTSLTNPRWSLSTTKQDS